MSLKGIGKSLQVCIYMGSNNQYWYNCPQVGLRKQQKGHKLDNPVVDPAAQKKKKHHFCPLPVGIDVCYVQSPTSLHPPFFGWKWLKSLKPKEKVFLAWKKEKHIFFWDVSCLCFVMFAAKNCQFWLWNSNFCSFQAFLSLARSDAVWKNVISFWSNYDRDTSPKPWNMMPETSSGWLFWLKISMSQIQWIHNL